jgi:hypothetical protein
MVFNSQQTLTASTAVASIASAALLTLVGLCIPYTERALNGRGAALQMTTPSSMRTSAPQQHDTDNRTSGAPRNLRKNDRGDAHH